MRDPARRVLLAGLAVAALPLALGSIPGDDPARLERLIIGYALAGLPFLYVWRHHRALGDDRRALVGLIAVAALGRLALLALPPLLSEDLWRYLWDGAVQWSGHNPYLHPPDASALDPLTADPALAQVRARVGHPHIPTIYPPFAQIGFLVATALGPHALLLRLGLVLADLGLITALWRLLPRADRPRAALYAFAPLPLLEAAVGAHVDVLGAAALVAAALALARHRALLGGLALAAAIWTKLVPVLALPALRRHPRAIAATLGAAALMLAPYLGIGDRILAGLRAYGQRWRANDGLFAVIHAPFEWLWPPAEQPVELPPYGAELVRALVGPAPGALPGQVWPDEVAFAAAKLVVGVIFGLVCLWVWRRPRPLTAALGPILTALFLVSPVIHPWYLVWVLPLAALHPRAPWSTPVIAWSLLTWTAYLPRPDYLRDGTWTAHPGWLLVEYLPVWALLLYGLVSARSTAAPPTDTPRSPSPP